jgi:phosphatidate cytidylyltransferase
MNQTTGDILLLALGVGAILLALTIFAEVLRSKAKSSLVAETFATRVESWWAIVILLALAMLIGPLGIVVLFAFASFAALREFATFAAKSRADHLTLALGFFAVLPLQFVFVFMDWPGLFTVFIPVYAFLLLPVISVLRGTPERFLVRTAEIQWGLMVCVFALSHIPALMRLHVPGGEGREILLIAFLIVVVQAGDLLDFFFGRRIGRHRIVPDLSPKTWEGAGLGVASAILIGFLLSWLTPFGPLGAALMAGIASATGMAGNLVLTAIKRDKGVKDWSHLIPGQGGYLDQLDSVIFAAPVFWHLTHLWWT